MRIFAFAAAPILMALGCASLASRPDIQRSAELVETAVGAPPALLLADEHAARARTAELLEGGLSAAEAAQVALLNNPSVRAAMIAIGISRADFVQSTLFSNPALALSLRFPDGGGLANLEVALTQNIAELWLIPARTRVAQRDLDRSILEAARTAAAIALDARMAYVRAVRAVGQEGIAREHLAVADRLVEVTLLRQTAGSGSEVDVNLARIRKLESETALRDATLVTMEGRSDLGRVLGLAHPPESLVLADSLRQPPDWAVDSHALRETARACRLDLKIADQSVAAAEARVREERIRFLKTLDVGFSLERGDRRPRGDRNWAAETFFDSAQSGQPSPPNLLPREKEPTDVLIGPTFGVELPLWDQNQAQIAKAERLYQQSVLQRDALLIDAAQDIYSRLAGARTAAENARFYLDQQLPAAEKNAELSRDAYRAGRLPFLSVLEAERNLLAARSGYLAALEQAALATIELERVTGRPAAALLALPDSNSPIATQPAGTSAPAEVER